MEFEYIPKGLNYKVYKAIDLLFVACKGVCLVLKGTYPEIPF
jgi:hypothetical protein